MSLSRWLCHASLQQFHICSEFFQVAFYFNFKTGFQFMVFCFLIFLFQFFTFSFRAAPGVILRIFSNCTNSTFGVNSRPISRRGVVVTFGEFEGGSWSDFSGRFPRGGLSVTFGEFRGGSWSNFQGQISIFHFQLSLHTNLSNTAARLKNPTAQLHNHFTIFFSSP